jgi:Flp pilus assembly protein TadD
MRKKLVGVAFIGLVLAGCSSASRIITRQSEQAMREGVRAATRKYWQEALFRFEQARTLTPDDAAVLNNLAVAFEATGRYDEALTTYKRAIELAPRNPTLKRNYARFAEFYTSYARGVRPKKDDNATR